MIPEWVLDFLLEAAVALAVWGLAVAFPFRRMAANSQFRWDLLAVGAASVFAVIAANALYAAFGALSGLAASWYELLDSWSAAHLLIAYILFADFTAYWAHRFLHTRLMWHSHAFHHSPRHLYVLSGLRASFLHIAVLFAGPIAGFMLFPVYESPLALLLVTWSQILNQHFIHSNLRVPLARQLEYVFVTPRFHFVHHSVDRRLSDRNFGFLLSVWDRLFGTYVNPENVRDAEPLGLGYANSNLRLLAGLPPAPAEHSGPASGRA